MNNQSFSTSLSNIEKRKILSRVFLFLFVIAVIFVWNVFSDYSNSSIVKKSHYLLRFNLNELTIGEVRMVHKNGLPIVVMHRTKQALKQLLALRSELSDPDSVHSRQPTFAKNYYRSLKPEYFIAYAVIPRTGSEVVYRLEDFKKNINLDVQWYGGFSEILRTGFIYDKAGRIYKQLGRNLDVPNYKITANNQLYVYTLKELDFD